jgi:hypothetical protein
MDGIRNSSNRKLIMAHESSNTSSDKGRKETDFQTTNDQSGKMTTERNISVNMRELRRNTSGGDIAVSHIISQTQLPMGQKNHHHKVMPSKYRAHLYNKIC